MNDKAAINGNYSDFRIVKTRSVGQAVIEFPIERAEDFIRMFGLPKPGEEIPVALARLNRSPAPVSEAPARDTVKSERAKANFAALPDMKKDVVKAAMMVKEPMFQGWLLGMDFDPRVGYRYREQLAERRLKERLDIQSKAEIGESREVNERWHTLLTTYQRDTGQLAEVRS